MKKIIQHLKKIILSTFLCLFVTTVVEAQMPAVDKNVMEENKWVIKTSAQTFLPAFSIALGEVTTVALAGEESILSQMKLGDKITIGVSSKELSEVVDGKEQPPVKTITTKITYGDGEENLMIKMYQEETSDGITGVHSLTNDGVRFTKVIDELDEMGIKTSAETELTKSSVTLNIPLQLLRREGLYETFKASEVYKSARQN